MKKTEEQRTEEEKQMLYNYEILQTETDEKKDAEALIKLCVLPEQVKTYLERYNVNSKLLKHSPEIYKRLKERISTKKIGQKVFTGEERSKWGKIVEVVEKINKFFELGNCEDNNAFEKGFIDLFNIEADINDIEIDEVMKNFMIEIEESGMLEVFLSKMAENKKNIDELYKTEGTSISEISTRQQLNSKEGINSRCQLACTFISDILVRKNLIEEWEKYGSNGDHICSLIKSVNDPEFTKECIKNYKKYELNGYNVAYLIKSVNDPEFTKECIKNYKKYKLNDDNVADLIRTLNDLEYIKGFVKEEIQNKNINGKNIHYIIQLALFTKDMELIENLRKNCDAKIVEELDRYLKIQPTTLPKEMTIGVEIESEGPCNWENIRETIDEAELDWVAKDDGSLQNGTEVVSTILTESTASMEIFKICQELRRLRQTTSKRCGGHIHIGADYLTDIQDWRNLRTIWNNAEGIFYAISNAKGEIPRQGVIEYASPISKKDETFSETIKLDSEDDLEKYIKLLKEIQGSKYSGINYRNVGSSEKNTIEFRLPNGTINPTTWVENINLFGGLIRTSHELSKIMKKTEEQRTEEEKQMLYNYEILQTETDEKKDAEALIKLCVLPEQVKTYLERYNVNSKLLKHSPEIYKRLKERISTKKIGQKVFTGEERSKWGKIVEVVEKINKFFELGNCEDNNAFEKGFIDLFNIEADINDIEIDEVMKNFMIEIEESGMLEVFLSKMAENKKNIDELYKTEGTSISEISTRQQLNSKEGINSRCQLACTFISDILVRKNLIEEWEKYGSNGDHICSLIKSVNDPEFTKECIKNYKKYELDGYNVVYLIKSVNDPEFIKECIENRKKYGLYSDDAIYLIKSFQKKCKAI